MAVEFVWNGDAVVHAIQDDYARRVATATEVLADAIRAEAPVRSGNLRESVIAEHDPIPPVISGSVRVTAPYARFVLAENPFVSRGLVKVRPLIQDILGIGWF